MILQRLVQNRSVDRHAGIVDPRIKSTETSNGFFSDLLHILELPHITNDVYRLPSLDVDLSGDLPQRFFISRIEHHSRATFRSETRRNKPDARRRTSDDDYLVG